MNKALRGRSWLWLALAVLVSAGAFSCYEACVRSPGQPIAWQIGTSKYQLIEPRLLAALLLTPLLIFALLRSLADLPWQQRLLSLIFRLGFIAALSLSLGRLVRSEYTQKLGIALVIDVSDSVSDESLDQARARALDVAKALRNRPDDQLKLITFAERPRLLALERDDAGLWLLPERERLRHRGLGSEGSGQASDLEAALQLAYGSFAPGYLKRVLLMSDGVETRGHVLAEAARAAEFQTRLFVAPFRQAPPAEVAVRSLRLPDKAAIGEPFEVTTELYASRATHVRARLYQGETLNGLDAVREVELEPGVHELRFRSVVRFGGEVGYRLVVDELASDQFAENNQYEAKLEVPGRPSVLYIEGKPERATYLAGALGAQQFEVDVRAPSAFPVSLSELERYDLLVVSDVPAEQIKSSSQDIVERYVRDLGGGFVFVGGEAGYGLGGWGNTTFERLLPVRMDVERRKDVPSVALALVIDRSGSMTGLPMEMAKAACAATVETLASDDLVEVIAFDSAAKRYVKMQPARYRSRIQDEISRIQPGGGTRIFPALDAAYQDISVVEARKKHVLLMTDGRADSQGIRDLVQAMIAEAITVTTVGLGDDADQDLLRMIAEAGGGRYHHVPDPNSLPRVFTRETEMVARQAAVVEWFPVVQTSNADFLRGLSMETAPLLHGYVATELKAPPAQMILASETGEPILARWHVGLGWAVAWTSDVKNNWAIDWIRWPGFGPFWGQLAREHMRREDRREFEMKTELFGGQVRATVDAFTADDRFDNDAAVKLWLSRGRADTKRQEFDMRQIAPGRYQAEFQLDEYGSFLLRGELFRPDASGERRRVGVSYGQLNQPYPLEYAIFEPNIGKLTQAAQSGGGRVDPTSAELVDPGSEHVEAQTALRDRSIFVALFCFLLDLLVRRVRLFDRKMLTETPSRL